MTAQQEAAAFGAAGPAQTTAQAAAGPPPFTRPEFFVLRTPLLPFGAMTSWSQGLAAPAHWQDPAALGEAIARDRASLRERLDETVSSAAFRDAVYIASPDLEAAIDGWRKDPDSERGLRAERSLVAYFLRAAARPTPFGLFAGCTTGTVRDRTQLRLPGREHYRRHTRLDMDYLWRLAMAVARDPVLRASLTYRPNSSLYERGDRLLFLAAGQGPAGRSYQLVAVGKTPYLMKTIERAREGARLGVLADALAGEEITTAEATAYLEELVSSQILVPATRPQLTGEQPDIVLAATLAGREATSGLADRLRAVSTRLAEIDAAGAGADPQQYRDAAGLLAGAPAIPEESRFVQVDLTKPAPDVTIGPELASEVVKGAAVLHAFTRPRPDDALREFRERFRQRYETREMPLTEVLDEENGIGFGHSGAPGAGAAPLLAGLPLQPGTQQAGQPQPGRQPRAGWTRQDEYLLGRLCQALATGRREISLTEQDAAAAGGPSAAPLPGSCAALAAVAAESEEAIASGDFQLMLYSVSGPPGIRLLSRFCHADPGLHELARTHLRAEEAAHPDCVFAEIVHMPEGRVGNILCRPVLRDWEIPYLGDSGAPAHQQLPVTDLLVSVRGDRILLRSRSLGREVIPRLSNTHNHARSGPAVYRFLCELSHQGVTPGATWNWGPLAAAPFLPRVVSGRVVLSRACWNLGPADLAAFREPPGAPLFAAVQRLRQRLGLPRHVVLTESDNELVADLDNVLSVEALAHQARRQERTRLTELFPDPPRLCVSGPEGRFTHQLIVPLVRQPAGSRQGRELAGRTGGAACPRRFPPGSEWLYLKLFAGTATADLVLRRAGPVMAEALAAGAASKWFFIRYGDPDWHVRLRLHGEPRRLLGEVLPRLRQALDPLISSGQLWRMQADTYEREVERYGGECGIGPAERLFHADSEAALAIVGLLAGDAAAARWQVALAGIDLLFTDLGLTLVEKREVTGLARRGYGREFGAGKAFQRAVGQRFRQHRPALEVLLDPGGEPPPALAASREALRRRSAAIAPVAAEIRSMASGGVLTADVPDLAASFAHMHVNRLLPAAARAQELVIYEMLDRLYASRAAREGR